MANGYTTRVLHTPLPKNDAYGSLHMPVYDGVGFEFGTASEMEEVFSGRKMGHAYARTSNPTVDYFERKLKNVTDSHAVLAMASGMAAISSAIFSLVENGGNIISSNHLFGHTYALFRNTLASMGIEVHFADVADTDALEAVRDEHTRAVFFETITNPQLEIVDITKLADWAHGHGIALVADSTTTPPYVFNSKLFGVDVEVMSATKFISGGATTFGGAIVDNGLFDWRKLPALEKWGNQFGKDAFIARLRKEIFRHLGGSMTAHTAHYMNLGLDILALRVDKCVDNTRALAESMARNPLIKAVNYPSLPSNPGFRLAQSQFNGKPGAILTFDLESEEACFRFMDKLKVIRRATNLNDNKSLIIHPYSTIYAEFTPQERLGMGVMPSMMRLSVGIEDVADLVADIQQALS
ncbi:MAG: PLP-dependent transferase [Breznakibacter sp.]